MRALAVMALVGCTGHGSAGEICSAATHEWSLALPLRGQSIRLASGNTVVIGDFGRLDLGDGLIHNSVGPSDLYFASFDPAGVLLNLRRFEADQKVTAITADDDGSLAIAGTFAGELDLGGGPVTATGERSMYVARFSADGRLAFLDVFGDAAPSGIAVSPTTGDVAIVGDHATAIDFGSGELAPAQFLLVLDRSGDHVLDRNLADGENVTVRYAGSDIAVAGSFVATFDLGGAPLASAGGSDIYVGLLDADGNHLASRSFGGTLDDGVQGFDGDHVALAAVPAGFVLASAFTGTIDLGDGPHVAADDLRDVFVVGLDTDLEMRWNRVFANPGFQAVGGIDADADGAVAITGISDGGELPGQPLACGGEIDANGERASHLFAATLERNGVLSWTRCFAATNFAAGTSVSYEGGSLVLGGILDGELDVAGATLVEPDTLGGFTATVTPQCE